MAVGELKVVFDVNYGFLDWRLKVFFVLYWLGLEAAARRVLEGTLSVKGTR